MKLLKSGIIWLSLFIALTGCHKKSLPRPSRMENIAYDILTNEKSWYFFDGGQVTLQCNLAQIITEHLPAVKHIPFYSFYKTGLVFCVSTDVNLYSTGNRSCYYLEADTEVPQKLFDYVVNNLDSYYLIDNRLYCFSYPELLSFDIEDHTDLLRQKIDFRLGDRKIFFDEYLDLLIIYTNTYPLELENAEFHIINSADGREIESKTGHIIYFDGENHRLFYTDGKCSIFCYDYAKKTDYGVKVDYGDVLQELKFMQIEKLFPVQNNGVVLFFTKKIPNLISNFFFPWSNSNFYTSYYFYGVSGEDQGIKLQAALNFADLNGGVFQLKPRTDKK